MSFSKALSLALALSSITLPLAAQTTTLTALTGNQTSACDGVGTPGAHCEGAFVGLRSAASGTYVPPPGPVSTEPLEDLLYPGATTAVYAHLMPWFLVCNTMSATFPVGVDRDGDGYLVNAGKNSSTREIELCASHVEVGYESDDPATVRAQMDRLAAHGFDGVVVNWYGRPDDTCPGASHCVHDQTTLLVRDDLEGRCTASCPLHLTLNLDQGSFKSACSSAGNPAQCILDRLRRHLDYADATYFGSPSYLATGGRPVVSFFIAESEFLTACGGGGCSVDGAACTGQTACWSTVWSALRSHAADYPHGNPRFIFRNAGAFAHAQTDGGYAWRNQNWAYCPDVGGIRDRTTDPLGLCYLDHFFAKSLEQPALQPWSAGWGGSDDAAATWGSLGNWEAPLRCGQSWLLTMKEASYNPSTKGYGGLGAYYSPERQLPFLQVVTWNDYEEGTAIEPGIDNCWAVDASLSGTTLSWSLRVDSDQPDAAFYATPDTITRFDVYDSADGENLTKVGTVPRTGRSIDLCSLPLGPGARTLYVHAVGVAMVRNEVSNAVAFAGCSPPDPGRGVDILEPADEATVASPIRVVANETSASETASAMQIYLDGGLVYEKKSTDTIDTQITASPGRHRISVKAWYGGTGTALSELHVNVAASAVAIDQPADGATVASPIRVIAREISARQATAMQIYLNGNLVYSQQNTDTIDTQVTAFPGAFQRISVKAWYADGSTELTSIHVDVQ